MSDIKYYSVITDIGRAQLANCLITETPMQLSYMAVGDGGGSEVQPKGSETQLVNEVYRGPINSLDYVENDPTQIEARMTILPTVGGFTIREAGLLDADGNLIVYLSLPTTVKPTMPQGTGMDYTVTIRALVGNDVEITLKIDPGQTIASREYVDKQIAAHDESASAHEAALEQHDSNPDAHAAAINKHNIDATAHAALMAAHNADENANPAAIAKHNADPNAHSGNDLQWINCGACTRIADDKITVTGDQTATYPRGKRLRFNGSDDYLCRVYGVPTYSDGVTTITVWFDFGLPDRTIPATVTKLERRPLRPEETGETIPLMTTTYSAEVFQELILSRCIGGGSVRKGA